MFKIIHDILWAIATSLIITIGIFFTFYFTFRQFRFKKMCKSLFVKKSTNGITQVESLLIALGCRIGIGSIAGVALCIHIGGIGSIFWMLIITFISAIITFVESCLGIIYKEETVGGPSYYIKKGLGYKKTAFIYAFLVIICYSFGFIGIQANTITSSITNLFNIRPLLIGICIFLLSFLGIKGGIKKISKIMNKLVPIMGIFYLILAIFLIIVNITQMPFILLNIIKNAFNFKSIVGGFIPTMIVGIQRGIFASESGIGTGSITSSSASTNDYLLQGYVQMVGIYITFLVCFATALIILTSNYEIMNFGSINGIEIVQYAFFYHFGIIGKYLLLIVIILFSFSTILTGYYTAETCLKYFFSKISDGFLTFFKLVICFILFICCFVSPILLWKSIDLFVSILTIINMIALFKLKDKIFIKNVL